MFKVEKPEYVNKTFRLDRTLLTDLENVAQRENISINALVIQCCRYALNDMEERLPDNSSQKKSSAKV